mgnify:CR=1 FL=1
MYCDQTTTMYNDHSACLYHVCMAGTPLHTYMEQARTYMSAVNYTIKLVTSHTYGCSDSITSSIFVKPVPNAQFSAVQLDTCKLPANYSLVNNSTGSIAYIWDFGDGSTSNLPNLNHSYSSLLLNHSSHLFTFR